MHTPRKSGRRLRSNIGFRPNNVLGLERLERRLTLSHSPAPGSFEIDPPDQYAPHSGYSSFDAHPVLGSSNDWATSHDSAPTLSPGGVFAPVIGAPPGFADSNFGRERYSPEMNSYIAAPRIDYVVIVVITPNIVVAPAATQSETPRFQSPPPSSNSGPEFRAGRFVEPTQVSINAPSESRNNVGSATGNAGGELQIRGPAGAAEAVREARATAPSAPSLPPQVAAPMYAPTDASAGRIASGLTPAPAAPMDGLQAPAAPAPQGESNSRRLAGGTTTPAEQAAHVALESVSDNVVAAVASLGAPTDEMISMTSTRAALLASLPLNMEAVDQAVEAMMGEVEKLGGELATWLDESSVPPWALVTAVVGACGVGAHYVRRSRRRRNGHDAFEEESSNWLFTRLQSPAGQL